MDPVWEAVATALAGKAGEAAVAGGRNAWEALVKLVRTRFGDDVGTAVPSEAGEGRPAAGATVESMAHELAEAEREDPEFGRRLRTLWEQVGDVGARSGEVVNQVSGLVFGPVVQARDIQGGSWVGSRPDRRSTE
ncbi:hypothetical protein [Saccharomonospora cyanea]|uniref:Uncharacterized protein n=1 Tax=Saccharomonospora cyanea NA-134 TaxID=882082 RepID=H5XGS9_9PSEU|nr:hypothetical protein [Saccharomonospora cyanea]EHR61622.1 hypothetical protein SaccyDRAFT_2776 [Saccharomonospora cyanea NA-134]